MFKIVSTAAIAALLSTSAMATTVKIPPFKFLGGQFVGATQYTGLIDPDSLCANVAGLGIGQNTSSVATVPGLGLPWTQTIANSNPLPSSAYGVSWINCSFAALPLATAFTGTNITPTAATPTYLYTSSPTAAQTTSCLASTGVAYTLISGNDTINYGGSSIPQTLVISGLPANGAGKDFGFKVTSTNSALAVGGNTVCFLSTDAVYLNSSR